MVPAVQDTCTHTARGAHTCAAVGKKWWHTHPAGGGSGRVVPGGYGGPMHGPDLVVGVVQCGAVHVDGGERGLAYGVQGGVLRRIG